MAISRRRLLSQMSVGFANIVLAGLVARNGSAAQRKDPMAPRSPHFYPQAKAIIHLYMEGGPSQIDTFDPKPLLDREHGNEIPLKTPNTVFNIGKKIMKSPFRFRQHGESGAWVSELFPNLATCADDLTIIRSMHHGVSNHSSACYKTHTGYAMAGKPCMGSWITYGLGSEADRLPGFVVLDCGLGPSGGAPTWGNGFLPSAFQGTRFMQGDVPVENIKRQEASAARQLKKLQAIRKLNAGADGNSRLEAAIANYEMAYRMQSAVPELTELADETDETQRLYGMDEKGTELFGSRLLLARRMVERGVRFIEVFPPRVRADRWDQHGNLKDGHRLNAAATDKPIAGLIQDLKRRGLLDETIVVWGGEFGRTPNAQGNNGRDHNPYGYTMWVAGGGFKPGIQHGATDEFGYFAIQDKVHIHDLHATLLHQMGIDHEKLTYRFSGRDFRLTDVHGHVVKEILM